VQYSSLYVGLSRVRSGSDIRLFPALDQHAAGIVNQHPDPLHHLTSLKPSADLATWWSGFDEGGAWSRERTDANVSEQERTRGSTLSRRRQRTMRIAAAAAHYTVGNIALDKNSDDVEIDATYDQLRDVDADFEIPEDVDDNAFDMLYDVSTATPRAGSSVADSVLASQPDVMRATALATASSEEQCSMDIDSGSE
jgi:hypothetical protein